MERVCPNCGTATEDDLSQKCFNCNAELPPIDEAPANGKPEESAEEEEVAPLGDGQFYCPECMTPVAEGAERCFSCNADLSHMKRCPSCTIGVDEIAEICPHCFNVIATKENAPKGEPPAQEAPEKEPPEVVPTPEQEKAVDEPLVKDEEEASEKPGKEKRKETDESGEGKGGLPSGRKRKEPEAEETPKKRFGRGRKKEEPEAEGEEPEERPKRRLSLRREVPEPAEEADELADDDELARQRKEERKRKIKEIMDEEGREGPLNYYNLSIITMSFHIFMFVFVAVEFFLYASNMTSSAPGVQFNFAPIIGGLLPVAVLVFALILTAANAFLHYFDRKVFLWLSLVPSALMMGSIAVTLSTWTTGISIDIGLMFVLFVLYLIMLVLDLISISKYPPILEDPGRGQLELFLEKEDEIDKIKTEMMEETERLLAEEEEKLKMKTEEMKQIEQHISDLNERIAKEEESIKMKEDEISAIRSELDVRNQQLMEEEEKVRMKEEEMESLIKAEIEKRTESFVMEEQEKLRMKEEELIKTHSDLDIQKNLFEENREKLRLKEQELTTLKQELEGEIRQRLEEEEKLKLKEAAARLVEKTKQKRVLFPFVALVGQERMKRALVLNAIYPEIGGVLIRGQKGTGKSVGVRGLSEVLPDIKVTGCRYNCDPADTENLC